MWMADELQAGKIFKPTFHFICFADLIHCCGWAMFSIIQFHDEM